MTIHGQSEFQQLTETTFCEMIPNGHRFDDLGECLELALFR